MSLMVAICHESINPAETFGSGPYLTNPKEALQERDPRVESLAMGTSFVGRPHRRNARSGVPQLTLQRRRHGWRPQTRAFRTRQCSLYFYPRPERPAIPLALAKVARNRVRWRMRTSVAEHDQRTVFDDSVVLRGG